MATSTAYSPKEYTCWIIAETEAGTSALHASNMYQLDIDSVAYPSLNVNQALDVRSGIGRTLKDEDFFQDNVLRVTELSISGTLHNDVGHKLLLRNVCQKTPDSADISVVTGYQPPNIKYGASNTTSGDTLTIVVKALDPTVSASTVLSKNRNFIFTGCVCTNFSISSDMGTEGGRYKFSATLQTGFKPNLNDTPAKIGIGRNAYANTTDTTLASTTGHEVLDTSVVMNSFTCTVDNPANFTGATANGFDVVNRGSEISVTVDTQIKLDEETKGFVNTFDTQSAYNTTDSFVCANSANFGINMENAVITNMAFSEGDIMMLDCSLKAVDDGSEALVTFDTES